MADYQTYLSMLPTAAANVTETNVTKLESLIALMESMVTDPEPVNKDSLNNAIANAQAVNRSDYTSESLSVLDTALNSAIAVAADEEATQPEVDLAVLNLNQAVLGLVSIPPPVTDKTMLEVAIEALEDIYSGNYTSDSFAAFTTALNNAKAVKINVYATQEEIDEALDLLNQAFNALIAKDDESSSASCGTFGGFNSYSNLMLHWAWVLQVY